MIYLATTAFYGAVNELSLMMFGKEVKPITKPSEILNDVELLIFSGGADISPTFYGEKNTYSHCNMYRDSIEEKLLKYVVPLDIPLFGICRGHQLISAYFGGKLHQDLNTNGISHAGYHDLITKDLVYEVNSYHHQGVYIPAENQEIIGWHKEVSELTRGENYPYVTTQFHPEFGCTPEVFNLVQELIKDIM